MIGKDIYMVKKKIQIKYIYIMIICIISIMLLSLSYIYKIRKVHKNNLEELTNTALELKKDRLKEVVNRTIQEIDIEREYILNETTKLLQHLNNNLTLSPCQNIDLINAESTKKYFSEFIKMYQQLEILVWDKSLGKLIYTINSNINIKDLKNEKIFMDYINKYKLNTYKHIKESNKIVAFCISNNSIEEKVKNNIKNRIRKTVLENNDYIWINEILNYNGGDGYAIRLVHPNLLEEEGTKLSTNTKDIKGNLPYLNELEGIKKDGEIFHYYYFKKNGTNYISHKLSYAKLYPKYNWIICCGIYLDDFEDLIDKKNNIFYKDIWLQINITIIIAFLCFIISGIIGSLHGVALMKQKSDIISHHYNILENRYDKTNGIIHDIKNHLICINALAKDGQSQRIIQYIKNINKDIRQLPGIPITNNKMLDIIINDKIHLMGKHNINLNHEIQIVNLDFIENKDICTIMSNLLDNAIESCIKSIHKDILLKIHCFNNSFIVIKIINSCDEKPIIMKNNLITNKKEKAYHGYGIKNIKKSLDKYSGNMTWNYDELNKKFTIVIILPISNS
ncbi:sensor histidine kinase, putative virS [Clostridium tetani E88]|uniref:Sensor histidine kinase, putative virS n=3 Tax=Clostridium tetani TaxID=1513 RepID=Q896P9_CLOTE|nr:sensor histidine kinase, putative virS [Clostridium tetani E88]